MPNEIKVSHFCFRNTLLKAGYDFIFAGSWAPLIRKSAVEKLRQKGIELVLGPAELRQGKHLVREYAAIQADTSLLVTEVTKRTLTLSQCTDCGMFSKQNPLAKVEGRWQLVQSHWPAGQHLVRLREFSTIIAASPEFVAAVKQDGLTGIVFEGFAEWV